jgi:superoxide dismutase, Cu-Zn family
MRRSIVFPFQKNGLLWATLFVFSLFPGAQAMGGSEGASPSKVRRAVAVLHPTEGNTASGVVRFEAVEDGVKVSAVFSGLPGKRHGFHVHEYGDCSASDAESAGGHYNPFSQPHGCPDTEARHMGDLGNLEVDGEGKATYERVDRLLKLDGPHSIIGRSMMVHAEPDDCKTQPTGAAGDRLSCGVIGIAE